MSDIIMYKKSTCPYCKRAKDLLNSKGVEIEEIEIAGNDDLRSEMMAKSGGRHTVPQIFINGEHIGGSDDLYELEQKGELDKLLSV